MDKELFNDLCQSLKEAKDIFQSVASSTAIETGEDIEDIKSNLKGNKEKYKDLKLSDYNDLYFHITANKSEKGINNYEYTISYNVSKSLVTVDISEFSCTTLIYIGLCSIFDKMLMDLISGMEQLVIELPKDIKKFSK